MNRPVKMAALRNISLALLCALVFSPSMGQTQVIDKIVAKVNDDIILLSDLEFSKLGVDPTQGLSGKSLDCKVLEALVINKMLVAKAKIDSVVVDDETIENQIRARKEGILKGPPAVTEVEIYKRYGKTLDELIEEQREKLVEQLTVQKMQQHITSGVTITPSEVKKFYKNIPKDSLPYISTSVEVSQIIMEPKVTEAAREAARKEAEDVRRRVLDGQDFEALAPIHSDDPGSAIQGGYLGQFCRGELVPEFEATCMKLNPGEYSNIVESDFGFHFIQLISRHGNCFESRHILIKPEITQADVRRAGDFLDSIRTLILADSMTFAQAAHKHSDDLATKNNGGALYDPQTGLNRIAAENMNPALFFTIDTMKVGSISKPMLTKTPTGEDAQIIVYYKSKTRAHKANLRDDYQMISNAALAEKKNKVLNEWFEKNKNQLYIYIDPDYSNCQVLEVEN